MSAAGLAARAVELLGRVDGPVAVDCLARSRLAAALTARVAPASDACALAGAVVVLLGRPAAPAERQALLHGFYRRLVPRAPLVLLDHNQPRTAWRRLLAIVPLLAASTRPARARYPAAREVAALGFAVERLELACGERVQLVLARR